MLYVKEAKGSVEEICAKIEEATKANRFGVIEVIDLKAKMAAKGVSLTPECRIVEICNPGQAKKVLEADLSISTALPCRVSVYEEEGRVKVATLRPTVLLAYFGRPELAPVAQEVEETILRIIDCACG